MSAPLSLAAKAALAQPNVRIRKSLVIWSNYLDADLRTAIDVTDNVAKWGPLVKPSTLKNVNWTIPNITVSLVNDDARFSPFSVGSVWESLGVSFDRCVLRFAYRIPLPNGAYEETEIFPGAIVDVVLREEQSMAVADIVTRHMMDGPLKAKITKHSGDEHVALGTLW